MIREPQTKKTPFWPRSIKPEHCVRKSFLTPVEVFALPGWEASVFWPWNPWLEDTINWLKPSNCARSSIPPGISLCTSLHPPWCLHGLQTSCRRSPLDVASFGRALPVAWLWFRFLACLPGSSAATERYTWLSALLCLPFLCTQPMCGVLLSTFFVASPFCVERNLLVLKQPQ